MTFNFIFRQGLPGNCHEATLRSTVGYTSPSAPWPLQFNFVLIPLRSKAAAGQTHIMEAIIGIIGGR